MFGEVQNDNFLRIKLNNFDVFGCSSIIVLTLISFRMFYKKNNQCNQLNKFKLTVSTLCTTVTNTM